MDFDDFDDFERDLWAGTAAAYERGFVHLSSRAVEPLLDAALVGEGTRVLDVGTGPGPVAAMATRRGALVSAVDADAEMVAAAVRNVPGLDARVAVVPPLPFGDGEFDAVVGNFVINHVGDPAKALVELGRVLRPGGRLALTCWRLPLLGFMAVVGDALALAGVEWPDDVPLPPLAEHAQVDSFGALLIAAGFTGVAVEELVWEHVVDAEEAWNDGPAARVGANGVVISRQDPETRERIKRAFFEILSEHSVGDGRACLPAHALLGCAVAPA